jgi:nucleoside-diphosphate-sugar epimerase
VIGTGETWSVRQLCERPSAIRRPRLATTRRHDDRKFERPAEVELLVADPSKAARDLGWTPSVRFRGWSGMMVDADLGATFGRPPPRTPELAKALVTGAAGFVGQWLVSGAVAAWLDGDRDHGIGMAPSPGILEPAERHVDALARLDLRPGVDRRTLRRPPRPGASGRDLPPRGHRVRPGGQR